MENRSPKKTIALNTAYLYISSFVTLFIGLYTSRVLLQVLGVKDFGLYGVVGSIVSLLGLLNIAMGSASSRYLTYELAQGDLHSQRKTFSAVFLVHIALAMFLFVLAETIGLWYICNKLEVPADRVTAAYWVYQSSILIGVLDIIQVPYNALVNAHERMGFSSLWGTINTLFKLFIVLILSFTTSDRLIFYAILMFGLSLVTYFGYLLFCKIHFAECKLIRFHDRQLFYGMLSFAGYSAFSSSSGLVRTQGAALLINKFFGVVMNASANIANMVTGYISGFTQNVIAAFRPQIIKCYANCDIPEMQNTVELCLKYSIAIFSLMAVPVGIEMDYILSLWLGNVPQQSDLFCRIGLIGSMSGLVTMTMTIAIQATSKVKMNSLLVSSTSFLSLGVTFLLLFMGKGAYMVFVVYAATEILNMLIATWNVKVLIHEFCLSQLLAMFLRLAGLMACSMIAPFLVYTNIDSSLVRVVLVTLLYILCFGTLFWIYLLEPSAKLFLINKVSRIIKK